MGLGLLQAGWPGKGHLEMMRISELRKDLEQEHFSRGNGTCEGPEQRVSSGQLQNERESRVSRTQNKGKVVADEVRDTGSHSLTAVSTKA